MPTVPVHLPKPDSEDENTDSVELVLPIETSNGWYSGVSPNETWISTYRDLTGQMWKQWNATYTTTSASTTVSNQLWDTWNWTPTNYSVYANYDNPQIIVHPDDWAEMERCNNERRAERAELKADARTEASNLLAMVLTPDQRQDYEAHRYFDVLGSSGQLWRIHHGTSGNVRAVDVRGKEIMAICAHPEMWDGDGYLPTEDVLAAQALHLMHDDSTFLSKANIHRGDPRSLALVPALRAA
jgi:hypothetical protein